MQYHQNEYEEAKYTLSEAQKVCAALSEESQQSGTYEAITLNLGHCYRKLMDFDKAIQLYEKCSIINPKCPQAYIALGYTYHLKFEVTTALKYYHKAHFLKNEDNLVEELIKTAMEDINNKNMYTMEETFLPDHLVSNGSVC